MFLLKFLPRTTEIICEHSIKMESSEKETNSDQNMKEFHLLNLKLDQNIQVKIKNIDISDLMSMS